MKQVKFVDEADTILDISLQDKKIKISLHDISNQKSIEFYFQKHEIEDIIYELIRLKKQL